MLQVRFTGPKPYTLPLDEDRLLRAIATYNVRRGLYRDGLTTAILRNTPPEAIAGYDEDRGNSGVVKDSGRLLNNDEARQVLDAYSRYRFGTATIEQTAEITAA